MPPRSRQGGTPISGLEKAVLIPWRLYFQAVVSRSCQIVIRIATEGQDSVRRVVLGEKGSCALLPACAARYRSAEDSNSLARGTQNYFVQYDYFICGRSF